MKGKASRCSLTDFGLKLIGEDIDNARNVEAPYATQENETNFGYYYDKKVSILIRSPMGENLIEADNLKDFQEIQKKLSNIWAAIESFWPEEHKADINIDNHVNEIDEGREPDST